MGRKNGSEVHVSIEKDGREHGMKVPEEVTELLMQDGEAKAKFDLHTLGKHRHIIDDVASVKSPQLRIDRAVLLLQNMKRLPRAMRERDVTIGKELVFDILAPKGDQDMLVHLLYIHLC